MGQLAFCGACGKQQPLPVPAVCPYCKNTPIGGKRYKDKTAAGLLAIFLGWLGAHRFYLGQWWGIFYLLFFWTWIPGLVSFIEGIVFLCTDAARWDEKRNAGVARGAGGNSTGLIIGLLAVAFVGLIAVIGMLAAVAIPAYQDYTNRAKLASAAIYGDQAAAVVGDYVIANKTIPADLAQAGFAEAKPAAVESISIDPKNATISLVLAGKGLLGGKTFLLVPTAADSGKITWSCGSDDIPQNILPKKCHTESAAAGK
ncbi:Fimbrial protein [Andreprevotia sp. IGB-42]|uniref:NINE protein n=1 Tax=Andreprevotia sp. IGB-42 TaxID=2497473 RepID=UPI00135C15AB|nr:NINE protein [Andreprevotia sp. IGB-42]KAF0813028.1 Fimbrial protein [Andreprevotia sp. IGB-42]